MADEERRGADEENKTESSTETQTENAEPSDQENKVEISAEEETQPARPDTSPSDEAKTAKPVSDTKSEVPTETSQSVEVTVGAADHEPEADVGILTEEVAAAGLEENGTEEVQEHNEEDEYEDAQSGEDEEVEDEDEDEVAIEGEREEGDGEEEGTPVAEKPLDHDEDRRNPQYIPKRGMFYEHDDRTGEDAADTKTAEPPVDEAAAAAAKKKTSPSDVDRWTHDLFDADEQGPKSDNELKGQYGYDIRKEEGAPRARRRRRYGRGPNKYARNWEDEQAYAKPGPRGRGIRRGGGRGRGGGAPSPSDSNEFPSLEGDRAGRRSFSQENPSTSPSPKAKSAQNEAGGNDKSNFISFRRGGGGRSYEERPKPIRGRGENMPERGPPPPSGEEGKNANVYRGGSRFISEGSQRGGGARVGSTSPGSRGRGRGRGQSWRQHDENQAGGGARVGPPPGEPSQSAARFEANNQSAARSKRYSSQRQRAGSTPPPGANHHLPPQGNYPPASLPQNVSYPPYNSYPDTQAPNFPPIPPMVAHHSPVIAYPPTAAAHPPAIYPGYPPAAPPGLPVAVSLGSPQSQDVYGAGIMYYNTDHQFVRSAVHAGHPSRRPNAAIPIVAPTEGELESMMASGMALAEQ